MRTLIAALSASLFLPSLALADSEVSSARLFATESVRVREDGATEKFLTSVAQHLAAEKDRRLRVEVHADERVGTVDNTLLASLRAKKLIVALKKLGVKNKQLSSISVGHSGVDRTPDTSRIVFDFADDTYIAWPGEK